MVELKNISLYFVDNQKYVLKNIDWHIRDNENWILFGKNGAGKTKLLEIITGYLSPSRGEVRRFGNSPVGNDIREIRKRIGYISTSLRDKFPIKEKVIDVVLSGIYASIGLYDEPGGPETEYARELLSQIKMGIRAGDRFSTLSDGEKQKILMLRAFINHPDLLIFDEASKGLDLTAREDLLASIAKICNGKKTSIVYVTHHIEEITPIFKSIFIIDNGECFFNGTVRDGMSNDVLQNLFQVKVNIREWNKRFYSILE